MSLSLFNFEKKYATGGRRKITVGTYFVETFISGKQVNGEHSGLIEELVACKDYREAMGLVRELCDVLDMDTAYLEEIGRVKETMKKDKAINAQAREFSKRH